MGQSAKGTILLVDDSPSVGSILKVYLVGLGVEILEASNGERALELARQVPLSLVISDIKMPGMDGFSLVAQIRADPRRTVANVPVVLLTSDQSDEARAKSAAVGANALLHKPVSSEMLVATARKFLAMTT